MKVLVTGANGQLGYDVVKELSKRGHTVIASDIITSIEEIPKDTTYLQMDLTDKEAVNKSLSEIFPDAVVHCAAWTAVDAAEDAENRQSVLAVNVRATGYIAKACKTLGCKMLYISTDYVFSGQGTEPWHPDCQDFSPQNVYGESKLLGEQLVSNTLQNYYIVRIAWVFGSHGNNFVKTMLKVGKQYDTVRVVNDQIGTPTYTRDLSVLLADMIKSEKYGYYHVTNEGGYISWYDFCCEIYRQAGYQTKIIPISSSEYGLSKAKRPFNSRLDKTKLIEQGFQPLPLWQEALARYLEEEKTYVYAML